MEKFSAKSWVSVFLGLTLVFLTPRYSYSQNLATTQQALLEISKGETKNEIRAFFEKSEVKKMLQDRGVSENEIDQRLAGLSDYEMQSLKIQVQQARAGGDLLVTVLLIILIIYFARRI